MDELRPLKRSHPVHRVITRRGESTIVFVTVCTRQRIPMLATDAMHRMLVDVWSSASAWLVGDYLIMPDHVHLLLTPGELDLPLTNWIAFWKRAFTKRHGRPIWQDDYWDTTVRSPTHLREISDYVEQNPVRRGLVIDPASWPYRGTLNTLGW